MSNINNNFTILIVDDISENIKVLSSVLNNNNYTIKGVTDAETALTAAKIIIPDLILLDIKMPGMDGFEVCDILKKDPSLDKIPVIFITALSDTNSKVKAFEAGGVDYITKPFHSEEVLARVKTQLKIARYTKMLQKHKISLKEIVHEEHDKKVEAIALFQAAFEQSHLGMSFLDKDGEIFLANSFLAEMLGYEADELIGLTSLELTIEEDIAESQKLFQKLRDGIIPYFSMQKRCHKKDGSLTWINTSIAKISHPSASTYSFISICEDINEKKALEKKLQTNEDIMLEQSRHASMGELMGMIAHQWKQPISVINMVVNNLKIDLELDTLETDTLDEEMSEILNMTEQLSSTIDDFRNFLKANKEKENCFMSDILNQANRVIGKSLKSGGIEIQISNLSTTELLTYPNELVHVCINIINNAKDAIMSKKLTNGKIVITVEEDDSFVKSTICDNAGGIPEDVMEKIGTRYFTTKEDKGTGLGIYMSRIIIENRMKGKLTWYNTDIGACFCIKIPK